MTPSEEAKQFAADHGYTIRRDVDRLFVTQGERHVGNCGKYPQVLRLMADDFAKQARMRAPAMPRFPNIRVSDSPRWRLWWTNKHVSGHQDFHNYAGAVKQLRQILSNPDVVIIKGTKYSISRIA